MIYIILAIILIISMIAIFRDDHDRTYDREGYSDRSQDTKRPSSESRMTPCTLQSPSRIVTNRPHEQEKPIPEPPKPPVIVPKDKTAVHFTGPLTQKYVAPEHTLSWSYLFSLNYYENLSEEVYQTIISGMKYYCSPSDIGPVNGTVRPEPDNPHDPRAQVVIRSDGKKLGYLPRHVLDEYEEFNKDNLVCPFSGSISVDRHGWYGAYIRIALPHSRDFVEKTLSIFTE